MVEKWNSNGGTRNSDGDTVMVEQWNSNAGTVEQ